MRKWSVIRQWTVEAETAELALELAAPGEHETVRVSVIPAPDVSHAKVHDLSAPGWSVVDLD
jgi:hypothetical protein